METEVLTHEDQIRQLEEEISAKRKELLALKKQNAQTLGRDYFFTDWDGNTISLPELFGDREELILVHNMGKRCSYCTLWADGFNGVWQHLNDRAAFVVVSPDSPEIQKDFAESRGWEFIMVSDGSQEFTTDMGFAYENDGMHYVMPGVSTFKKESDGTITRVAKDTFGPGDDYCSVWYLFGLLEKGENGWSPKYTY